MTATARVVLTDIEGTTSAIRFVKDVLFPYAARAIPDFLRAHHASPEVAAILDDVAQLGGQPRDNLEALIRQLLDWIDEDRKITPLKTLQGLVWRNGYESGAYRAHVYPDAVAALQRWHRAGVPLYVYSSGSIAAQKLFFRYSEAGDLTALFSDHFDTTIGGKREADAYRHIIASIGHDPAGVLFLSDVEAELDAAADAGLLTCWLQRPEDMAPEPGNGRHPIARDFNAIPFDIRP